KAARRQGSARWGDLRGEDLLDPLRDVTVAAATSGGSAELSPPARPEMLLQRGAGDVGDRHAAPLGLVAKPGIEVVGELHGGAPHGMPAYHYPCQPQTERHAYRHSREAEAGRQDFSDAGASTRVGLAIS